MLNFLQNIIQNIVTRKKLKKFHLKMIEDGKTDVTWKRLNSVLFRYNYLEDSFMREDIKSGRLKDLDRILDSGYLNSLRNIINEIMIENDEATQEELEQAHLLRTLEIVRVTNQSYK